MIQAGRDITAMEDRLQKITIEQLYHSIQYPKPDILNQIRYLRIVKNIDKNQYSLLKKKLPYFVCGIFNPNIRRLQNFAFTEYFLFDIDHISEKGLDINTLKNELKKNENVLLCFVSPSEDGLKVLFQLSDRCYDASLYSIFYKTYLRIFSSQYHLEQVIDKATSDVTRACFISYDREAYFNPDAKPVDLNKYIDQENTFEILQLKKKYELREKEENKEQKNSQETQQKEDVPDEIVDKIKTILKLSTARKKEPLIFVPEELNRIMNALLDYLMDLGIVVKEVRNINYGKKIKTFIGNREAEINIFYGKRGFSVVQSPRTGTSPEMNQLLAELIENFLQSV